MKACIVLLLSDIREFSHQPRVIEKESIDAAVCELKSKVLAGLPQCFDELRCRLGCNCLAGSASNSMIKNYRRRVCNRVVSRSPEIGRSARGQGRHDSYYPAGNSILGSRLQQAE